MSEKKYIKITLTKTQFEKLNKIVETGIWGNTPSGVVRDIIISKLYTSEKTIEKALEKAGWEQTYMKGVYLNKEHTKYCLARTFTRKQNNTPKRSKRYA